MNRIFKSVITLGLLAAVAVSTTGCLRKVEAGNVGVKVYQLGGDKGVDQEVVGVGRVWVGWNEDLFIFPTFTQNYVYEGEEQIRFQDKDGLPISTNINVAYHIDRAQVATVFQKYRKGVDEITSIVLRREIENAFNALASNRGAEYIYGVGRSELAANVTKMVQNNVRPFGIVVEKINMAGQMELPDNVKRAIAAKIQANQMAQQRLNEVAQAKAEADKARAQAAGEADSTLLKAEADAKAIKIRGDALRDNPGLVELNAVDKWDGRLPQYMLGSGTTPFINLNK